MVSDIHDMPGAPRAPVAADRGRDLPCKAGFDLTPVQYAALATVRAAQKIMLQGLDPTEEQTFLRLLHKGIDAVNDMSRVPFVTDPGSKAGRE